MNTTPHGLETAAARLSDRMRSLAFGAPVSVVYNPLDYAWDAHAAYIRRYAPLHRTIAALFVGMNPGPFGMAQTGVPFGEIAAVKDWLGISLDIKKPEHSHPKRPIEGFACKRSEVSGKRLWGLFQSRFGTTEAFFERHFVANYCPLLFTSETGANLTPDKLAKSEQTPLFQACDNHLREVVALLNPTAIIAIGDFVEKRAKSIFGDNGPRIVRILHPSPANPQANKDWAGIVTATLVTTGIWS